MSSFRQPLPVETPETGYSLFQIQNTNQQGEIDPEGENIVRKLYNSSEQSILYKLFELLQGRFTYSVSNYQTVSYRDQNTDELKSLTNTGIGSTSVATRVWNHEENWMVQRDGRIFYSSDDGANFSVSFNDFGQSKKVISPTGKFLRMTDNLLSEWTGSAWATLSTPLENTDEIIMGDWTFNNHSEAQIQKYNGKYYIYYLSDAVNSITEENIKVFVIISSSDLSTWTRTRVFTIETGSNMLLSHFVANIAAIKYGSGVSIYDIGDIDTVDTDIFFLTLNENESIDEDGHYAISTETKIIVARIEDTNFIHRSVGDSGVSTGDLYEIVEEINQQFNEEYFFINTYILPLTNNTYLIYGTKTDYDTVNELYTITAPATLDSWQNIAELSGSTSGNIRAVQ